jgi:hypothetical protein
LVSGSRAWERGHPGRIRCGLEARAPEDRSRNSEGVKKPKTAHAKAQRNTKWKSFFFFATFAYLAPLREPVFSSTDYPTASEALRSEQ